MKDYIFAVGDVHGQLTMLNKLLVHWQKDFHHLLFLGDLVDRGEDSRAVMKKVYELVTAGYATCLKGNHEVMFEQFLRNPEEKRAHFELNGGKETIASFLPLEHPERLSATEVGDIIVQKHPWVLPFIDSLPLYKEWHDFVFVHAGVDLSLSDWKASKKRDFVWIREDFYMHPNTTGQTFVFGHTPTPVLHDNPQNNQLWKHNNLIGIDGGAVYGGLLHGIVCSKEGIQTEYTVQNTGYRW